MMIISEDKKFKQKFNNIINKYSLDKDEKLFLDDFFCLCNCVNVNERIPLFKRIEFLIDRRGENKYDAVIETLKKVFKDKDTLEYIDEVEIINSIFVESKKLQDEIKKVKPEKRLAAMLLSASMVYHDKKNIPSNYRDKHIDLVNKTIKSLVFDNEIYQEDAFLYSNRDYYAFDRKSYRFEDFDKRDFEEDSNQLNRIADFYKANKKIVKEQFKLKKGVNIEYDKVKCIVVHSRIMHGMVKKNNVYALDIYKFLQPFNRDAITEYLIELNPELTYCLQGEVTADKILKYYENPFCIYNYVNCLKTHNTTYSVGEYTIIQDGILIEDWIKLIDHDRLFSLILEKNFLHMK